MGCCWARVVATREVSHVIQRRPHCSATEAVVPDPHVGSNARSPGSGVIRRHRWMTFGFVCATYTRFWAPITSVQTLPRGAGGKSSTYRPYRTEEPETTLLP